MANYRQYCPVALASEVLAERWNPLIVRNLMFGADTFSAIANGVPSMSRSMLIKRLDELQRAGVIETQLNPDGRGYTTPPPESAPPLALWAWCQVQLNRSNLPDGRTVIAFFFPEERPSNRRFWILIEHGDAEMCHSDPGGQADLTVEASARAFVDWHRGARTWRDVLRTGEITVSGPQRLRRAFPP